MEKEKEERIGVDSSDELTEESNIQQITQGNRNLQMAQGNINSRFWAPENWDGARVDWDAPDSDTEKSVPIKTDSDPIKTDSDPIKTDSDPTKTDSDPTKTDYTMAHLLRSACASKADELAIVTTQLLNLGVVSDRVRELVEKPTFDADFKDMCAQEINSPAALNFWKVSRSRFLNDFEEIKLLGRGGFGKVVLCMNKIDKKFYAMKKIPLKENNIDDDTILREVATLSRLEHKHIVRYYQAWFETGSISHGSGSNSRTGTVEGLNLSNGSSDMETTYLYIQMEHCQWTLRKFLHSNNHVDAWNIFHQIVDGLSHIHSQGIVHRDLNPNNIFLDAQNDIKIGDFGLAKFLKSGELNGAGTGQVCNSPDGTGTGQVGTELYRAHQKGRPKLNQKADIYSLGVIFIELCQPFGTEMERRNILTELKKSGNLPSDLANRLSPEQAKLVKMLTSLTPSNRPTSFELLQHFSKLMSSL